ncbi:porin [Bradyrhizobium sp. BWA-3-5]|uniref:porin n=1 Tax=Bradyrhizobium sp. BWA-3-5 TaxID=3080013 RepID=UPI00293EA5D6|nr:porin [Bradyrhizobium sp. BWA-3-5]WOH68950.1 porin [Bradyrhizobium sp. BWA-3-5]
MKMVKSLILGSAAGLIAMGGAQAADLPVKAKAVEYVRICSLYGAGFFYIPGTDTCLKLGGYLRVDTTFNGGIYGGPAWSGDIAQGNRYRDYFAARSRLALTVDTRTATEYGVVRTFGQANIQFSTLGNNTFNPNSLATNLGNNTNLLDAAGAGYVAVDQIFLQFAGFTFGKSVSAFATPWNGYPGNNNSFLIGGPDYVTGVNNIQYTAQFGNGVSGTIGLDEPTVYGRTSLGYLATFPATAATATALAVNPASSVSTLGIAPNAYGGVWAPDIVGNIRVDQAWGLFQISGLAHLVNGSYNVLTSAGLPTALSEISGHPESKWGGAVMAALQIKNLPTGPGDDFKIDATYAHGATKAVISTSGASPSFGMFGGTSRPGAYQSYGFGYTSDGVYVPGGDIQLTDAWGVRGAFNHNWDPYWSTSLWGSYSQVRYNGTATAQYCAAFTGPVPGGAAVSGRAFSADFTCDPDFNVAMVGAVTRWTPVKNLTFSAEVGAFFLDQKMTGAITAQAAGATSPKPVATYEFRDQSTVFLNIRAQRNF